jgi:SAM-dependent MidA family methyltransferase
LSELPAVGFTGVVLANELLDNLPVDLLEWRDGDWQEVRVAAGTRGGVLSEALVPAPPDAAAQAARLVAGCRLGDGARLPLQLAAAGWVRQALSLLQHGRLVLFDYGASSAELACAPWTTWLRTFRRHRPGGLPLEAPGLQDITCVVATDQLAAVRPPSSDRSQAEWLTAHGIGAITEEARSAWRERAAIGDLEAVAARSRVHEAEALVDPEGLGTFRALEWVVP